MMKVIIIPVIYWSYMIIISMAQCKAVVIPLPLHWSYLSHTKPSIYLSQLKISMIFHFPFWTVFKTWCRIYKKLQNNIIRCLMLSLLGNPVSCVSLIPCRFNGQFIASVIRQIKFSWQRDFCGDGFLTLANWFFYIIMMIIVPTGSSHHYASHYLHTSWPTIGSVSGRSPDWQPIICFAFDGFVFSERWRPLWTSPPTCIPQTSRDKLVWWIYFVAYAKMHLANPIYHSKFLGC